jgi:hypothetical protein
VAGVVGAVGAASEAFASGVPLSSALAALGFFSLTAFLSAVAALVFLALELMI